MRIISGTFGSRRFNPPAGIPARPTTDIAKGGLFNVLDNMIDLEGIKTLDLYAGTGSISYELASRGAADLTLVERDNASLQFIGKTAKELGISHMLKAVRGDVFKYLKSCTEQYDLIFADPPYALDAMDELPVLVFDRHLLKPEGLFILEHDTSHNYEQLPQFLKKKNYGTTIFSFFTQPNEA